LEMNARHLIVAASVFAAAGKVLAGDVDPFADHSLSVSAQALPQSQASQDASTFGVRVAGTGSASSEWESAFAYEHVGSQNNPVAHTPTTSVKSREDVHAEAVQAAKDRMTKGVSLLPGGGW
jgi:hypothetical protein